MDRRTFLRLSGGAAAGAVVLIGCADDDAPASGRATSTATSSGGLLAQVAPDARPELIVVTASFEYLVGQAQPFAFGLTTGANEALKGLDVEVYVAAGDQLAGPFRAAYRDVPGVPLGLYLTDLDLAAAGPTSVAVIARDGRAGMTELQVATPETSQVRAPGDEAIAVPTATFADPRGLAEICTRQPPCSMHEVSLDAALAEGRPVMLTFATPAYCQTAVCGPSVDVIEQAHTSRDWGDLAWIHVEVYADAGQTLAEPVERWALPSEPWLFVIGRDARIVQRIDGPLLVLADRIEAAADAVA